MESSGSAGHCSEAQMVVATPRYSSLVTGFGRNKRPRIATDPKCSQALGNARKYFAGEPLVGR